MRGCNGGVAGVQYIKPLDVYAGSAYTLSMDLRHLRTFVAVADMERDRRKDAALQRLGLTPLRFTDARVEHDPRGVLQDVRYFLDRTPRERPAL